MPDSAPQQLLHLVIGGELTDLESTTFKDLDQVEIVGVFPNYASAHAAWKAKAQQTVDNAHMRYFVVHLHRLLRLDPFIDIRGIETEFIGQPDQPQILGREKTHSALNPAAAQHIAN